MKLIAICTTLLAIMANCNVSDGVPMRPSAMKPSTIRGMWKFHGNEVFPVYAKAAMDYEEGQNDGNPNKVNLMIQNEELDEGLEIDTDTQKIHIPAKDIQKAFNEFMKLFHY